MKQTLLIILLLAGSQAVHAQSQTSLDSLKVLIGKWTGEGQSEVGAGGGYFTFEASLKDKVLIRKNHAEYPATKDRATVIHEDLMIVYVDGAAKKLRAFYTDTEGNTINYLIAVSDDQKNYYFRQRPERSRSSLSADLCAYPNRPDNPYFRGCSTG